MRVIRLTLFAGLVFTLACGDDDAATDASTPDAAAIDGAQADTGNDGGPEDAGQGDVGPDPTDAGGDVTLEDAGADAPVDSGPASTAMSFFVTSTTPGDGSGDIGGIEGADAHCRMLAEAAGAERTEWFAYLSTTDDEGEPLVNAVDRIGSGPWYNAEGDVFATDLESLHPEVDPTEDREGYIAVKPADALFLDENGGSIGVRQHDIFTGSTAEGMAIDGENCDNWTSDANDTNARVGHSDTPEMERFSPSWNSAHNTRNCTIRGVAGAGGVGFFYCFATD